MCVLTHTPAGVHFSCCVHACTCVYVLTHTPIGVSRNQKNLIGGTGIIGGCEPPPLDVGIRVLTWILWKSRKPLSHLSSPLILLYGPLSFNQGCLHDHGIGLFSS